MIRTTMTAAATLLLLAGPAGAQDGPEQDGTKPDTPESETWQPVSGEGIHYFSTSVMHSEEVTDTGAIRRSTDIVTLTGDVAGTVLYHPVTEIDGAKHLLTNSGHQVFSGTVLGGAPVLLFDDSFTFTVDLKTGRSDGTVILDETLAGPETICRLTVSGTGEMTEAGDSLFTYEGECKTAATD